MQSADLHWFPVDSAVVSALVLLPCRLDLLFRLNLLVLCFQAIVRGINVTFVRSMASAIVSHPHQHLA